MGEKIVCAEQKFVYFDCLLASSTFSTLFILILSLPWWPLTFLMSSARDQCVWRPGLSQLQSQQQHVVGRQQRSVTGGAAPGLWVPPQGQRDAYQHPHAETWEHKVLRKVERKRRGGDPQHSHSPCWGLGRTTSRTGAGLHEHSGNAK